MFMFPVPLSNSPQPSASLSAPKSCVIFNVALDIFQALPDASYVSGPLLQVVSTHGKLEEAHLTAEASNKNKEILCKILEIPRLSDISKFLKRKKIEGTVAPSQPSVPQSSLAACSCSQCKGEAVKEISFIYPTT